MICSQNARKAGSARSGLCKQASVADGSSGSATSKYKASAAAAAADGIPLRPSHVTPAHDQTSRSLAPTTINRLRSAIV